MSITVEQPINDLMQSVERPIVFDILRQLQSRGLFPTTSQIRFYGEDGKAAQYNSTISKDPDTDNLWPHRENITIEVDEEHDQDTAFAMALRYPDNRYIFIDDALEIGIRPAYSHTQVEIRMLYKAVDRNQSLKWHNDLRARFANLADVYLFDVSYSWHVPDYFVQVLRELHCLRNKIAGYGDEFDDWLRYHGSPRLTTITNQAGQGGFLAMAETQTQVTGMFAIDMVPDKATRDDEPNLWVTSLSFKFSYDKPIKATMNYPIMVHQQLLPKRYRPDQQLPDYYAMWKKSTYSWENFRHFTAQNQMVQAVGNRGLLDPPDDGLLIKTAPTATVRALRILLSVNPTNLRSLINLGDLGNFNLDPDILSFMKASEWQYMTQPYGSIFQLTHYEGVRIKDQSGLTVDDQLNVSLTYDADLRKCYRLRLGLVCDARYLTPDAIARVKANPTVAVKVLTAINGAIKDRARDPDIMKRRLWPEELYLFGCHYSKYGHVRVGLGDPGDRMIWGLVESLFVIADRLPAPSSTES